MCGCASPTGVMMLPVPPVPAPNAALVTDTSNTLLGGGGAGDGPYRLPDVNVNVWPAWLILLIAASLTVAIAKGS